MSEFFLIVMSNYNLNRDKNCIHFTSRVTLHTPKTSFITINNYLAVYSDLLDTDRHNLIQVRIPILKHTGIV